MDVIIPFFIFWLALISLGFNKRRPLIAKFIIVIGCASLMAAAITCFYTWHFVCHAQRTSGKVVDVLKVTDAENAIVRYTITFHFQDANGLPHTVSSGIIAALRVGDKVDVLYSGDDPQKARIDRYWQVWHLPCELAVCGSIELLVGFVVLYWCMIKARVGKQTQNAAAA